MKNDTAVVRIRNGDHHGDAKSPNKAARFVEFNFLMNRNR